MTSRDFTNKQAIRESVPLLVGLMGPSGSGKTYSALRLASGMQTVTGGEIFCIDTESKRALHYADEFEFQHVEFNAPFSPLDYLAAIEYCVKKKAKVVIVDSMSHEHEGPGGVLEWHEKEMGGDFKKQFIAWSKPKAARRRLINTLLQLGVNAIFCFRAKEKMKIVKGKDPLPLGWMPIAGDEFLYEMTANCLLYPASGGVPTWKTNEIGEKAMLKLPRQFEGVFSKTQPLSEEIGTTLAEWAAGGETSTPDGFDAEDLTTDAVIADIGNAPDTDAVRMIAEESKGKAWTDKQREEIREAIKARTAALKAA